MADVDTQLTFAVGPDLPAPATTEMPAGATVSWPMRRGAVDYAGTVSWNGSPAVRRIVLLDLQSFAVIDATVSAPDGTWSMPGWSSAYPHLAVCIDSAGAYQAIAYDRV